MGVSIMLYVFSRPISRLFGRMTARTNEFFEKNPEKFIFAKMCAIQSNFNILSFSLNFVKMRIFMIFKEPEGEVPQKNVKLFFC